MSYLHNLKGKTLLLIDGTVHMINILNRARELGIRTVVANFYEPDKAKAKLFADEYEVVDISDLDEMEKMMNKLHVDGILQGCTDSHLPYYYALCQRMGFPCYGTLEQFELCTDKKRMKAKCKEFGVPVTPEYTLEEKLNEKQLQNIEFPVVIKPVDGSGSRGFSVCHNIEELKVAYNKAKKYSISGEVLVEKYMDYRHSVIIHYTIVDGKIIYSGISDKESQKVSESGSPIMSLQYFPSELENIYIKNLNDKVVNMLHGMNLKNGVVWIEAFYNEGEFWYNEMGYRFGGSLTYYPVEYLTGIKQLDLQFEFALTGKNESFVHVPTKRRSQLYCIFPMHVKPGIIKKIEGLDKLKQRKEYVVFVPTHLGGDEIQAWGSTQQVFGYIHFATNSKKEAECFIDWIINTLSVTGEQGEQLLYNLHKN